MNTRLIQSLCLTALLALTAGCAGGPSGSVTVEGTLTGTNAGSAAAAPTTLSLTHLYGASLRRVAEAPDPRIDNLTSMTLRIRSLTGGPFRDTFVLATVVTDPDPTESTGKNIRHDGDNPDWVRRRLGKLALLDLPVGDGSAGKSATRPLASGSPQSMGPAWLVRLEGGDPAIPWTIDEGDARCRAIAPSASFVAPPAGQTRDCFDLRTLAGMVLAHVAKAVTEGLDDGPLPSVVTATRHDLFIVPSLDSSSGSGGTGFGFIYAAELRAGERAGEPQATVYVPIDVHFRPAVSPAQPGLEAVFAPLGAAPWSPIGIGRVTVAHGDRGIGAGLAREIRSIVVETLERAAIPPIAVDGAEVPAGQAIGRMIEAAAPQSAAARPYSSNLDVVALPAQRASAADALVSTRVLSLPRASTRISTGGALRAFTTNKPAGPQAVAAGNGTVSVTTPLDPPGQIRRVTTLSPMQAGDPYELRILR